MFRKILTLLILAMGLALALPIWAQQKAFTQEQISNMVRAGLGDDSGAKLIEQRGIDFAPAKDFLQSLKAAGASETFLKALQATQPQGSASSKSPLRQVQILALLAGEVPAHRVAMLVEERGIDFDAKKGDFFLEVSLAGGDDELIRAIENARVTKPATVDLAKEAPRNEVREHVAHGAEFLHKKRYGDAEVEYRAAVRLDPQNADLHIGLSRTLKAQAKTDEALAEAREAVRLDPGNSLGHFSVGNAAPRKRRLRRRDRGDPRNTAPEPQ